MSCAATRWFLLCEQLGAGFTYTSTQRLPLLSLRQRPSPFANTTAEELDVVMADTPSLSSLSAGMKRSREDGGLEEAFEFDLRAEKRARPGSGDSNAWPQDSVLNTPTASSGSTMQARQMYQKPKYDSDDQSSMMSEPGSPQDIAMSDDDMTDDATFSRSPSGSFPSSSTGNRIPASPFRQNNLRTDRVPTPIVPPEGIGSRSPMHLRTAVKQHVRQRHPQENISSSDHLEVPSPIDEDEVPTPPSAAEAAGSQLSMLTVNDMDMEPTAPTLVPQISISPSTLNQSQVQGDMASAPDIDGMDEGDGREARLMVRKQRQRSGALSSGQGSPSPVRAELARAADAGGNVKRVLSMGYRADCEKCRMRVPGHMNHFVS